MYKGVFLLLLLMYMLPSIVCVCPCPCVCMYVPRWMSSIDRLPPPPHSPFRFRCLRHVPMLSPRIHIHAHSISLPIRIRILTCTPPLSSPCLFFLHNLPYNSVPRPPQSQGQPALVVRAAFPVLRLHIMGIGVTLGVRARVCRHPNHSCARV